MYREAQPGHIVISFFIFHFSIFDFNFLIFTSPFSFSVDISGFIFFYVPRDLTMYREAQPGHIVISFFIFHFSIFDFNFLIFTSPFSFSVDISGFIFLLFRFGF